MQRKEISLRHHGDTRRITHVSVRVGCAAVSHPKRTDVSSAPLGKL